ncbi:hypothetical protein FQN49_006796 [Arthroderma sp. PD_2]|nr:hypothetical protein FQN49_006796 [Arthroderma sp. PD_2]
MRVGDFIQASRAPNGFPASQTRPLKPVENSRQREVEMAKMRLPPTRLTGFNHASSNREYGNSQQENTAPPASLDEPQNEANRHEEPGDLFDTDLEGVDDSTTTISVLREAEAVSVAEKPYFTRGDTNYPGAEFPQRNEGYKSIAERIKELDSDDEEDGEERVTDHGEGRQRTVELAERKGGSQIDYSGDGEQPAPEPLSWQKIEAILREDSSRPTNEVDGRVIGNLPDQAQVCYTLPGSNENDQNTADSMALAHPNSHLAVPQIAPRPVAQRLSTRNRFAARPHFAAPDPYSGHIIGMQNAGSMEPHSTLLTSNTERHRESDVTRQQLQHPGEDQYSNYNRGPFDTATDLSTMECSDDDGFQEMADHEEHATFQSPHLSTVSAVSPKRPLSNFISDYPPNILESKSFVDLQVESFDFNPTPVQPIFQHDAPLSQEDKLSRVKTLTDEQRRIFFSSITLLEWEEFGDLLVEQFYVMLQRSKETRQVRRKVASVFEAEIKRRHDAVEQEGASIENRLEDMRAGGMGVLKGQTP